MAKRQYGRICQSVFKIFVAGLISNGNVFCDKVSRDAMQSYFVSIQDKIPGAPRKIAETVEKVDQCIALKSSKQQEFKRGLREFVKK